MSDTLERLRPLISNHFGVAPDTITAESYFVDDLGADSLDLIELGLVLEDELQIRELTDPEVDELHEGTVGHLVRIIDAG